MAGRTFGWVQEAYKIAHLKNVVNVFIHNSAMNKKLREDILPMYIADKTLCAEFVSLLDRKNICISYAALKGKGTPSGYTRTTAPCSGIIQATLPGQRRGYQSDWPADSYLRWAISIGFLNYDRNTDCCSIAEDGEQYATTQTGSEEEKNCLTRALLSSPPVCRVLLLLNKYDHMTKFELGSQLGFIGEAGFSSIPQRVVLQGLAEARTRSEERKLLNDTEGTSDKYARTICAWLQEMHWVRRVSKNVKFTTCDEVLEKSIPHAYQITLEGKKVAKYVEGKSKFSRISKRVPWEMLATKEHDRDYLRTRRAHIIHYVSKKHRTLDELIKYLNKHGFNDGECVIRDDICGLKAIGINIAFDSTLIKIYDKIVECVIPEAQTCEFNKSDISLIKDNLRTKLIHLDHKFLSLIDFAFDGKSNRDFEMYTAALFIDELNFGGSHLGGGLKPDVCVYSKANGLIIDNKSYSGGYSLPIAQADEMVRYLEDNKRRSTIINNTEWWTVFPENVKSFGYAFISGKFIGKIKIQLERIHKRTGVKGGAICVQDLLIIAEALKSCNLSYDEFFSLCCTNDMVVFEDNRTTTEQTHRVSDKPSVHEE